MKRIFGKIAVLLLAVVMCLSVCLLTSCGEEEKPVEEPAKTYNVTADPVSPLGEVTGNAKGTKDGGTLYEIVVTPKVGYEVKSCKINGVDVTLADNKIECVLKQDVTVAVKYSRKTSPELERRQNMVVEKINQYCDTLFKYDKEYNYNLNGRDISLKPGVLHAGLPYTVHSSISPDAFLDFAVSKDNKGVYTISFPSGYNPLFWGGSCGNAAYWAWATVSSTISFTYSGNMIERMGVYPVGEWAFDPEEDIKNSTWQDTTAICKKNGLQVMCEAYAMMNKGDAMQFMYGNRSGNHVIIVTDVQVARNPDGSVNPQRSKILYSDQHGGWGNRQSSENKTVYSSTNCNREKTFMAIFEESYVPMTCIELLDDSTPLAKAEVKDSMEASALNKLNVLRGYAQGNYAIRKGTMVIKDANGNEVFNETRYGFETNPTRLPFSNFGTTNGEYEVPNVYNNCLDLSALPAGEYHCVVTIVAATGEEFVVRDFKFQN